MLQYVQHSMFKIWNFFSFRRTLFKNQEIEENYVTIFRLCLNEQTVQTKKGQKKVAHLKFQKF